MAAESLDAHCSLCSHEHRVNPCRLNRTRFKCKRNINKARGRPLGFLLAWLAAGTSKTTRTLHGDMLKPQKRAEGDEAYFTLEIRQRLRIWLVEDGGFTQLLELERPRRAGEPAEPEGIA